MKLYQTNTAASDVINLMNVNTSFFGMVTSLKWAFECIDCCDDRQQCL